MNLFYEWDKNESKEENDIPLVDFPSNLQQTIKSIKDYAVNGNRLLIEAQAFDEIELVEAILTACGFVEKSFITAIIDCISQTRSNYEELQDDCERYKSCMADYESTIEELLEKIKTLEAKG